MLAGERRDPEVVRVVPGGRRWRRAWLIANAIAAACAAAAVLVLCAAGFGSWPALGPALDPGRGAWASAAGGKLPAAQTLSLAGLAGQAGVSFDARGIPTVTAASATDAALALGYLHASFRLTQMDLARRQAEGRLAALLGARAVRSDEFELRLGLLRTARREWAALPKASLAARVLVAYARGVNDYLAQLRSTRQWPALFALARVYPANWTPVDSLAIQDDLSQQLDFSTAPLDYTLLERSLGAARTMAWFPLQPAGQPSGWDPGPYLAAKGYAGLVASQGAPPSAAVATAAAAVLAEVRALPAGQASGDQEGSAWAANGARVQGGGSMLAGDSELPRALPAGWFQVALNAPGLDVTGVSLPGLPGVLIGHNRTIAWSVSGAAQQSAVYYVEKTSASRPGEYFWHGRWRPIQRLRYQIAVHGQARRTFTVLTTVHGPVLTQAGATLTVDWAGNAAAPVTGALLAIGRAASFAQFRSALAQWHAPAQTFVYADDAGHIGAIAAGYYPQVRHGAPWLPLPGGGADDVAGMISYRAVPQAYDPRGHLLVAAGQRPVTAAYRYYLGTAAAGFGAGDPGAQVRAGRELAFLGTRDGMTVSTFARLQASMTDGLAVQLVPRVLAALHGAGLTPLEQQAAARLRGWNREMSADSPAASIWWTFWSDYLAAAFGPRWSARNVPVRLDQAGLAVSAGQPSLDQVLAQQSLGKAGGQAFGVLGDSGRSARSAVRASFKMAVVHLHESLGGDPASWTWGKLHAREFSSPAAANVLGDSVLGAGAVPAGGDGWTVDAAGGVPVAASGPDWRMIIRWRHGHGHGGLLAEAMYPGGQSDNPASPWYANLVSAWWHGAYLAMPFADAPGTGVIRWRLRP